ncbi:capsid protein [Streptococcus gordonii]|uniref:Capsid protein n=1 Tax=Streptococcus gordonii TaxID=1302 RepID=A0A139N015_STRGN|nr:capsid protein [Streptococcus gordonii]
MSINYVTKREKQFDQKLMQGALTSILETPKVNWLGAKSFEIPTVSVSGYKAHTRSKGYNAGTVSNDKKVYTLNFDRDIEFFVDSADVDETNEELSAANVTGTFITEHATPELDAYRFSKLATTAITATKFKSEDDYSETNVYSRLKSAILPIRKYGAANIVIYVSSEIMDFLERSKDFTRSISTTSPQGIDTRVTSLDGVQIIEVWDDARFKTQFEFTDGFVKASGGKDINFLIVAKPAVIAKAKFNSIYLFAPGTHTEGDGYLYQNRMYHDLFVLENKKDGVYVSHKTA